jgi:hypothetical protein
MKAAPDSHLPKGGGARATGEDKEAAVPLPAAEGTLVAATDDGAGEETAVLPFADEDEDSNSSNKNMHRSGNGGGAAGISILSASPWLLC